jgi:hypothetical protein
MSANPPPDVEVDGAATVTVIDTRWLTVLPINSASLGTPDPKIVTTGGQITSGRWVQVIS